MLLIRRVYPQPPDSAVCTRHSTLSKLANDRSPPLALACPPLPAPNPPSVWKVHGVLRNLKLEAPKPSPEEARLTAASTTTATKTAAPTEESYTSTAAENAEHVSSLSSVGDGDDDPREGLPASLGRLGERRGDNEAGSEASSGAAGKIASPSSLVSQTPRPPPKYTWFSLYDEQGVGRRRMSPARKGVSGDMGGEPSAFGDGGSDGRGHSNPGSSARTPKQGLGKASSKAGGSWRWGWGRRESSPRATTTPENMSGIDATATARTAAAAAAGGTEGRAEGPSGQATMPQAGAGETNLFVDCGSANVEQGRWGKVPQGVEVPTAAAGVSSSGESGDNGMAAAGKKLAEDVERDRRRLKRKDVYSYFMMPLVRALEAQMGTTAWLRKVRFGRGSHPACFVFWSVFLLAVVI